MPGKSRIKLIRSLKDKKNRSRHKLFIAEGEKTVKELLLSDWKVHSLYALKEWLADNPVDGDFEIYPVDQTTLRQISMQKTPNSVVALAHTRIPCNNEVLQPGKLTLLLDTVQDPGNLGTLIRICDWFGIPGIICSIGCADIFNPKVVQAAMGSIFRIKVRYASIKAVLSDSVYQKVPVFGAFLEGESIYTHPLGESGFILLGNESKGISHELSHLVNHRLTIPSCPSGGNSSESLNVAVAGGIIISEFRRKHPVL